VNHNHNLHPLQLALSVGAYSNLWSGVVIVFVQTVLGVRDKANETPKDLCCGSYGTTDFVEGQLGLEKSPGSASSQKNVRIQLAMATHHGHNRAPGHYGHYGHHYGGHRGHYGHHAHGYHLGHHPGHHDGSVIHDEFEMKAEARSVPTIFIRSIS